MTGVCAPVPCAVFVTSMAAGSGLVGGVFAPSLFIGAAVGSSIGTAAQTLGLGPDGEPLTRCHLLLRIHANATRLATQRIRPY
jgi:H+/Cl- antiporter ClcA